MNVCNFSGQESFACICGIYGSRYGVDSIPRPIYSSFNFAFVEYMGQGMVDSIHRPIYWIFNFDPPTMPTGLYVNRKHTKGEVEKIM